MKRYLLPLVLILTVLLSSCGSLLGGLTDGLTQSLYQQNDVELVKDGAPSFLLLVEGFIHSNPKDRQMLANGIQMYSAYSAAFITDEERKQIFNEKTKSWAIALLNTYPKFRKYYEIDNMEKEAKDKALEEFLKSVKKKDVPYVFWAAYSWALSILGNLDSPTAFIELPVPRALIERVYELDATFYYGAPHLFFGIFYGAYPEAYGGDLEKAKEEFEIALKLSEDKFLMTKLFYADFYYKPLYDEVNYRKTVQEVIDADINLYPEVRLLNIMAQKQAERMLVEADEFFFNFD